MGVKVRIPTPLRRITEGKKEVEAQAGTVASVIDELEAQFAGFRERLLDEQNNLRRFVNIFVNDEDIRFQQALDTPVQDGDEVSIVPAIAGG